MNYNTATLSNGLRVIHRRIDSNVVYCGYQIAAGSRQEKTGEEGLAHFCEHTTFKGTQQRTSLQILNTLERVGGDLNAFTNKESTVYYAALLKEHLSKAIDLLTDIVFHSVYPQSEIDKEVEVICDEIESYNDTPAELIYDEFENILFEGHPLGHNILGTAERVRSFTTDDALRFTRKYYNPENAIFFIYGNVDFRVLMKRLAAVHDATWSLGSPQKPLKEFSLAAESPQATLHGKTIVRDRQTHQAHVMLGNRAYDVHHPLRVPLYLLNNILGGPGMNARLNILLREQHGLVYTVESTMVSYGDTGLWGVYFGCDADDVKQCLRLVHGELSRFIQKPLSERQLAAAKQQLKGQLGVACDNHENFALDFGKSFLHYGWERDLTHLYDSIDAVSTDQIQQVASQLFASDKLTTLVYQ